jgi:hypothetical protein
VTAILSFGPASAYAAAATIPFGQNQVGTATYYVQRQGHHGANGTAVGLCSRVGSSSLIRSPANASI